MTESLPESLQSKIALLKEEISRVFVGTAQIINSLLVGFFGGLHILLEDIPGVGKTTLARALAKASGLDFARIQFTPDLLPGDILGMTVWSTEKREFVFKPGAIMHQFLLADEINRASARTQSSLLEAMQETHIPIDGISYPLPRPFFVIATQNPQSFTGTFPLPEAQIDRFGISFSIGYPSEAEERVILARFQEKDPLAQTKAVLTPSEVCAIQAAVRKVYVDKKIYNYIIALARKTRTSPKIRLGLSPRASQKLLLAAQAQAFLEGRSYVIPEDVAEVAFLVIPHRLILKPETLLDNLTAKAIVQEIMSNVKMPSGLS